ncbi:MAG: hypothetical protein WA997_00860 [Anaerolineales bacterium]|jgi:hypothetical protein
MMKANYILPLDDSASSLEMVDGKGFSHSCGLSRAGWKTSTYCQIADENDLQARIPEALY